MSVLDDILKGISPVMGAYREKAWEEVRELRKDRERFREVLEYAKKKSEASTAMFKNAVRGRTKNSPDYYAGKVTALNEIITAMNPEAHDAETD